MRPAVLVTVPPLPMLSVPVPPLPTVRVELLTHLPAVATLSPRPSWRPDSPNSPPWS